MHLYIINQCFADLHGEQIYHLLINMVDPSLLPLFQGIQEKITRF
jgi:hypothetical protein